MTHVRRYIAMALLLVACRSSLALAQTESSETTFKPYTTCRLQDGLSVVETAPLAPGVTTRMVQTLKGNRAITMLDGRRVMFAYPGEDFYANVKVEVLPANNWDDLRTALVDNFDFLLASGDDVRNYRLKPQINGFAVQGQDRPKRGGGVLGFYLLFSIRNQRLGSKRWKSMRCFETHFSINIPPVSAKALRRSRSSPTFPNLPAERIRHQP